MIKLGKNLELYVGKLSKGKQNKFEKLEVNEKLKHEKKIVKNIKVQLNHNSNI